MPSPRRLTLLRHARARPADAGTTDHARRLDPAGELEAEHVARQLLATGIRPSLILCSPAARAMQTAGIVARRFGYPREFLQREAGLYLASADDLLQVIAGQDDAFHDILLCGHNPGLSELAERLTASGTGSLSTGAAVVIETRAAGWSSLQRGELRHRCLPSDSATD